MHISELFLGISYFRARRMLADTEYCSTREHEEYQKREIAGLLKYAVANIPFYHSKYRCLKDDIVSSNAFSALGEFPIMTKSMIRQSLGMLHRSDYFRSLRAKTSGSTSESMVFYMNRFTSRQREKAFMWDQWKRVGYHPGERIASFRGTSIKVDKCHHDRLFNITSFSPFAVVRENMPALMAQLNKCRPLHLHGYPSVISKLARLSEECGTRMHFRLKSVLCGSEKLYEAQRETIQTIFRCKVYSWYGHSEYAVLGGECEASKFYHLYPQYGFTELLPTNMKSESGEALFEIVTTGFNNRIMPFIRYKTEDYATVAGGCCVCGRQYPLVKEIVGRAQEYVVDAKNNLISATAIAAQIEKHASIDEFIIVQEEKGRVLVRVRCENKEKKNVRIVEEILVRVSSGRLQVTIEEVNDIPRTLSGKRVYVEQHLDVTRAG